jgi:hypothetical protein
MTKFEISRKLTEYHLFRITENACNRSRKFRKISVNLSENLGAYERSNAETRDSESPRSEIRVAESSRLEHPRLERACGGDGRCGAAPRVGRRRASWGSAAWRIHCGVSVGRRRRGGGGSWGGAAWRAWVGRGRGGGEAWCGGGRRRASLLAVDGGGGVGGRAKPRPTRGRVDGGGVVGMRGV